MTLPHAYNCIYIPTCLTNTWISICCGLAVSGNHGSKFTVLLTSVKVSIPLHLNCWISFLHQCLASIPKNCLHCSLPAQWICSRAGKPMFGLRVSSAPCILACKYVEQGIVNLFSTELQQFYYCRKNIIPIMKQVYKQVAPKQCQ